jgi:5-methylcytosine-specific restriction endonuclease McrBC GTP-binding regulatory subunit McrB
MKTTAQQNSELLSKPKSIEVIDDIVENENSKEEIRYVDLTYLNRRTKSNPELMMEMISIYLEQTPHLLNTIKQSLKEELDLIRRCCS